MSLKKYLGNSAEIYKVQYIPTRDVNAFIKAGTFAVIIELLEGKSWIDLYSTPGSVTFNEKSEETPAGTLYKKDVVISFPGTDALAQDEIFQLNRVPLLLQLFFQDGTCKVVGDPLEPAHLMADFEASRRVAHTLTILCQGTERCRFVYPDRPSIPG